MLGELQRAADRLSGAELVAEASRLAAAPRYAFPHTEDADEDAVSHFALRVAMAGDAHWRAHFLRCETLLFRARLERYDPADLPRLLRVRGHRAVAHRDLSAAVAARLGALHVSTTWIVVPWNRAGRLVDRREVVLIRGEAYVPPRRLAAVLEAAFHRLQAWGQDAAARRFVELRAGAAAGDPVVDLLTAVTLDPAAGERGGAIRLLGDIEDLDRPDLPLCVRAMDRHLRARGRINDAGRRQMGLFLKASGVPVAAAQRYFARRGGDAAAAVPASVRSTHAYNVRHLYGLEGARRGYGGLGCAAVVRGAPPTATQCHGCPFVLWPDDRLRSELTTVDGLSAERVADLLPLASSPTTDIGGRGSRSVAAATAVCAGVLAARRGPEAAASFLTQPAPHRYPPLIETD